MAEPAPAIFTWSIVTNIALISAGLKPFETFWMNILAYAGSAQLAVMPLIAGDFPLWTIWLTAFIVNLRFVVYSAGLQIEFRKYPFWKRVCLSYLNADIAYTKFVYRFSNVDRIQTAHTKWLYLLGMAVISWVIWQLGSLSAIAFGVFIPDAWGIGFAGTLALIALIVPAIHNKTALVSVLVAAAACILTINFPYRLSIVCSVIVGVIAAILMDKCNKESKR